MHSRLLMLASRRAASFLRDRISPLSVSQFSTAAVEVPKSSGDSHEFVKVNNAENVATFEFYEHGVQQNEYGLPYIVVEGLKYSDTHEWVKVDGNVATVGITEFGRHYKFVNRRLAVITVYHYGVHHVDKPTVGAEVSQGNSFGKVFLDKYSSGTETETLAVLYSPISGKVVEVNEACYFIPAHEVCNDPYGKGWVMKVEMKDASELKKLMDADNYLKFCKEEKHARRLTEMQIRESVIRGLKYSDNHMWVKFHGNEATVGITENGQSRMYRGAFTELPEVGEEVSQGYCFGNYLTKRHDNVGFVSPISGKIVAVNRKCSDWSSMSNWSSSNWMCLSPYEEGWMMKVEIKDASELEKLMDVDDYFKLCHEKDANDVKEMRSIRERVLEGLKYSYRHEWVKVDGNVATVGITRFGLAYIGSVKHVKLPHHIEEGRENYGFYQVNTIPTDDVDYILEVEHVKIPYFSEEGRKGYGFCEVETVNGATCYLCSPVFGKIVEVNKCLDSSPDLVNRSPYEEGWIMKVEMNDASELEKLVDLDDYSKFCDEEKYALQRQKELGLLTPPKACWWCTKAKA